MKAIVYDSYGPPEVLRLEDVPTPSPGDNDVLIRVRAASVNSWDWDNLIGATQARPMLGWLKPQRRIPGADVAGVVEAVGRNVTRFKSGDEVFGDLSPFGWGAFAEYARAPESALTPKVPQISFEQAAAIPQAGVMALQGIRDYCCVKPGHLVLINGAGGGVGSFAIQLAKSCGAEVTAIDRGEKQEFMRALGADSVIDYTQQDFAAGSQRYDAILDVTAHRSTSAYRRVLAECGRYFLIGGETRRILEAVVVGGMLKLTGSSQRFGILIHHPNHDLMRLQELVVAGTLVPAIDHVYPLCDTKEALRRIGAGNMCGKLVIAI